MSENIALSDSTVSGTQKVEHPKTEDRCSHKNVLRTGCIAVAFLIPLKLSLTYITLIPLILLWLWVEGRKLTASAFSVADKQVIVPAVFFLSSIALSSLFGINPLRSLNLLLSLFFFSTTLLLFSRHGELFPVLTALLTGQAIAAAHSVLDAAFPGSLPSLFIGKVSESGQLALTILVSLGLMWRMHAQVTEHLRTGERRWILIAGLLATLSFITLGFRAEIHIPLLAIAGLIACTATAIFNATRKAFTEGGLTRRYPLLVALYSPLLIAALMVNLKRGPWLGVIIGSTIFFVVFAPRLAALVVSVAAVCGIAIAPIADRLAASYQHFTIVGGRSTIWRIGTELIAQFPLGIGFHNSDTLRKFAPEVPPELRHFHNNLLNITAENGWLTCALFLWLILAILRRGFSKPLNAIHVAIGCAIIAWQTAGLVEYNVGDSEVMLVVWLLVGALLYDQRTSPRSS